MFRSNNSKNKIVIIGAGPAGLTAGYELVTKHHVQPIILEKDNILGGLSRTISHRGNRIDIGGHRFFSKSAWVTEWWLNILPSGKLKSKKKKIMLTRSRLSHILFSGKLFDYPITLTFLVFKKLGLIRSIKITISYFHSFLFPIKKEKSLEDFFINRFGRNLYQTFFKSYTEKVWGLPCSKISPDWGSQRIKGVSLRNVVIHALAKHLKINENKHNVETSLIDSFNYPKLGPGQLWEEVGRRFTAKQGQIIKKAKVGAIKVRHNLITSVSYNNGGEDITISRKALFSSMPIKDLFQVFKSGGSHIPKRVWDISQGLVYRDFLTVGLLITNLKAPEGNHKIKDNWIYIQEDGVKVGRIQFFNNWSPFMVADSSKNWIGMEYFCQKEEALWKLSDTEISKLATKELVALRFIDNPHQVKSSKVVRAEKAYPAYFGTYKEIAIVRQYLDKIKNFYPIGRNGQHHYNNQDHSMLTAKVAIETYINQSADHNSIWSVNTEEEYNETKVA